MDYRLLWAKSDPYHPLWRHLLDVAAVCEALIPRFGEVPQLPTPWTLYLVALHDLGKADPVFQNKAPDLGEALKANGFLFNAPDKKFRHEARSAEWICNHLKTLGWGGYAIQTIISAIRGHHGNFNSRETYDEDDFESQNAQWFPLRDEIANILREVLNVQDFTLAEFENNSVSGLRLSGLIVLSDWIASNHELFCFPDIDIEFDKSTDLSPKEYFALAQREANRAVQRIALGEKPQREVVSTPEFLSLFPNIPSLRSSQIELEKLCLSGLPPGLLILEAPMGEGKTEGAFYIAEHWRRTAGKSGAYIGLPTMATSNQMHGRYEKFLSDTHPEQQKPRLIHGMAWLLDDDAPTPDKLEIGNKDTDDLMEAADSLDWFRNSKRALIAPEGVGTVDQALRAGLNVKHGFLRLFGLANRVLVVDEAHSYDEFMSTILEKLLEWCRTLEIPVILLSATLSLRQKTKLIYAYGSTLPETSVKPECEPYPLITFAPLNASVSTVVEVKASSKPRTVELKFHSGMLGNSEATARLALSEVENGGCLCVLVNTVREAQEVFRHLKTLTKDSSDKPELMIFHSRFRAEVRQEIEKKVVNLFGKGEDAKRPKRIILVGTQVIEQSLDISFDAMITQIAPIDLILQRSGRLHRHEQDRPAIHLKPILHILAPSPETPSVFGGTGIVYQLEPLLRTSSLLEECVQFTLPADFRPLIEGCYSDAPLSSKNITEEMFSKAKEKRLKKDGLDNSKAKEGLVQSPRADKFTLPESASPKQEGEESDAVSYFIAQTRLEDDTITALVLSDPGQIRLAKAKFAPDRNALKSLFMQKVGIPGYMLKDVSPEPGYDPLFDGEKWLQKHRVLPLTDGVWRGANEKGETITITDDPILGLTYLKGESFD